MKITSSIFKNNSPIPSQYTCDGLNVNPPLSFAEIPSTTQSLALISDDPDAPMGTWVHWTLWNIDPATKGIFENSVPLGAVQGMTSFGENAYGGPCPPSGIHHYYFKLYALDTGLDLPASAKKEDLEKAMSGHVLAEAELVGLYSREK